MLIFVFSPVLEYRTISCVSSLNYKKVFFDDFDFFLVVLFDVFGVAAPAVSTAFRVLFAGVFLDLDLVDFFLLLACFVFNSKLNTDGSMDSDPQGVPLLAVSFHVPDLVRM